MTGPQGVQVPPDTDAKALVEAILELLDVETMPQAENMDAPGADVGTRMGTASGLATRLAVLLDAKDRERDEAWEKYAKAANALAGRDAAARHMLAALEAIRRRAEQRFSASFEGLGATDKNLDGILSLAYTAINAAARGGAA